MGGDYTKNMFQVKVIEGCLYKKQAVWFSCESFMNYQLKGVLWYFNLRATLFCILFSPFPIINLVKNLLGLKYKQRAKMTVRRE